jgi:hypothetical protein
VYWLVEEHSFYLFPGHEHFLVKHVNSAKDL